MNFIHLLEIDPLTRIEPAILVRRSNQLSYKEGQLSSSNRYFICMYIYYIFNKYKTFSMLIYNYINTSGNWENEKLCGNTTPEGRSVFTQFRVFPFSTSVDITVYQLIRKKCVVKI
jgi:hypothetical protein